MVKRDIIVIGASAGGVAALPRLLGSLAAHFPAAFFVTLHMAPHSPSLMPLLISRRGLLPAQHPADGAPIRPGHIYVAPPDYHLLLERNVVRLSHGPKENRHRPAIDVMFRSAAEVYGRRVAGVLLTGNLDDGVAGLREIHRHHGLTIVQDPAEAPYPEMPRNALHALAPDHCLNLKQIESLIADLPKSGTEPLKPNSKPRGGPRRSSGEAIGTPPKNGPPAGLVCPECQGPLWEIRDGKILRYQCLVGHRYSLESMVVAQREELETALWIALRVLEERINLQRRLAAQSSAGRRTFQARVKDNEKHARVLRRMLETFPSGA